MVVGSTACGSQQAPQLEPVTVQLNWLHYGAFGGLYAGDQNGDYAAEGLDVTFSPGGPDVDYIAPVVNGEAQFGVAGADALLLARAQGKPVRAIATILRRSPITLVSPAELNITRPQDLIGQTIRITPQIAPSFHAMMAHVGIAPDQYTEVVLPSKLELFERGDVPVWGVYFNSFAVEIQEAGHELNYILPGDYGVHFYSDSLFTTDEVIENDPELVTRFLRATLGGLRYAIENPQAVGSMVVEYDSTADPALEAGKMAASLPLIHTGEDDLGWMRGDVWRGMHDVLLEEGVLPQPVDVESVYTMAFLNRVYQSE